MATRLRLSGCVLVVAVCIPYAALASPPPILAEDAWTVSIPASAGPDGSDAALVFGTQVSATDGFDSGVDIPVSAPPPGASFGSYFNVPESPFPELNADYRPPLEDTTGSTIQWTLKLLSASKSIILHWSASTVAGLPEDTSLILTGENQTVDMRRTSYVTYPAGAHTVTITATRTSGSTPAGGDDSDATDSAAEENNTPQNDTIVDNTVANAVTDTVTDTVVDDTSADIDAGESTGVDPAAAILDQGDAVNFANLAIEPIQPRPGEEVTISATVCNDGDRSGPRTVTLMIDGVAEQSRSVTMSAGSCKAVTFKVSRATPGAYQVTVDDLTDLFIVGSSELVSGMAAPPRQMGLDATGMVTFVSIVGFLLLGVVVVFRRV